MPLGFRTPLTLALLLALAACSETSDRRGASPATEGTRPPASGESPAEAAPLVTEVKRMIRADQIAAARALFGLEDTGDTRLQVTFYDTPAFELHDAGLILRSRKVKDGGDDVTVKLRPLARSAVASSWWQRDGFKCEEDRSGATSVESCSLTTDRSSRRLDEVARGTRSIESLFSDDQREFIRTCASIAPDWSRLKVFGPIAAREWEFKLPELEGRLSAELWTLPDGSDLLELSTKVPQPDAEGTAAALDAALASRGLDPAVGQQSKTRTALEAFAKE